MHIGIRAVQKATNLVHSYTLAVIMAEEATVRGLKNPKKCSTRTTRNLLAKNVRLMPQRVVPGKKGKGSYKRKGRSKRSFFMGKGYGLVIGTLK
tara:strand:+ start:1572 stop:1853 length:282 start_codon:yes stop_codon:yes gene_type:complete